MGILIEDGKGSGRSAEVNLNNHLVVSSIQQSIEHYNNHVTGKAFNALFSATPTGAGDCFLYIKNTSEVDMSIEGFWLWLAASEYIEIKLGDTGTPVGGNDITPVNLNSGSGEAAVGTFQDGADITGLSGGSATHRFYHATSAQSIYRNFEQDIILKRNGVLTMYCQTGTTALHGTLVLSYYNPA